MIVQLEITKQHIGNEAHGTPSYTVLTELLENFQGVEKLVWIDTKMSIDIFHFHDEWWQTNWPYIFGC